MERRGGREEKGDRTIEKKGWIYKDRVGILFGSSKTLSNRHMYKYAYIYIEREREREGE